MKNKKGEIALLAACLLLIVGFLLYGVWSDRQDVIAKGRVGRYQQIREELREGKVIKNVFTHHLKADGQYDMETHFGYKWSGPKPNPKNIRPFNYLRFHPDGTYTHRSKGTYKVRGNEVDLMPLEDKGKVVFTFRFTEKGMSYIRGNYNGDIRVPPANKPSSDFDFVKLR